MASDIPVTMYMQLLTIGQASAQHSESDKIQAFAETNKNTRIKRKTKKERWGGSKKIQNPTFTDGRKSLAIVNVGRLCARPGFLVHLVHTGDLIHLI